MHCVHCSAEMRPFDKFCRECGEKQIETTPTIPVSTESPALSQPEVDPAIRERPPSHSDSALIKSVALVLVLILGVVGYRYVSQREAAIVGEGAATTTSEVVTTTDLGAPSQPATSLDQAASGAVPDCSSLAPTSDCQWFGVQVEAVTEYLDAGETITYTLHPQIGEHILTGQCGIGCNIGLEVHDANGTLVVQDVDLDYAPTSRSVLRMRGVHLSVTAPGQFDLTVSMHACSVEPCRFTVEILKKATTTRDDVAMIAEALILATAQLATVPSSADYTGRDWTDLQNLFPSSNWKNQEDPNYAFARGVNYRFVHRESYPFQGSARSVEFMERVNVEAKGTRSMILEATINHYTPTSNQPLRAAFESVFSSTPLRCDPEESLMGGERWYRVSPEGMKPVAAKYAWSAGSGGSWEDLTFDRSELPPVGTQYRGSVIWTDECSDSGADVPAADRAQPQASAWSVTTSVDGLTDEPVLQAEVQTFGTRDTLYVLNIKCQSRQLVASVSTFQRVEVLSGAEPILIEQGIPWTGTWDERVQAYYKLGLLANGDFTSNQAVLLQAFQYRLDDDDAKSGILVGEFNVPHTGKLFDTFEVTGFGSAIDGKTVEEIMEIYGKPTTVGTFSDELVVLEFKASGNTTVTGLPLAVARIGFDSEQRAVGGRSVAYGLPARRFLLVGVLTDDEVEFPFGQLSAAERRSILDACF